MKNKTKNKIILVLAGLFLLLLPLVAVKATGAKTGNSVYVTKDEIISGNLYAAGENVTIDGSVSGDLIAVAQTITVNGRIEGDIIAAGQDVIINGEVGGNIRIAGNSLMINGSAARNVNAFGAKVVFGPESRVGWDIYLAGANAEIRGTVDGSVSGQAGQMLITGKINKNIDLKLTNDRNIPELTITSEAIINGDVNYTSKNLADISDKASVAGKIQQETLETKETNSFLLWLWGKIFAIFSALTVGLALIYLSKDSTSKILERMKEAPTKMLLPGLILMLILPPLVLILIFTLIGIPLALIVGAWWISMIYIAKIFTAIVVGQFIIRKISKKENKTLVPSLILGVIVSWFLFAIPFVGWIIGLIAVWFGLGGIWFYTSQQLGVLKK